MTANCDDWLADCHNKKKIKEVKRLLMMFIFLES